MNLPDLDRASLSACCGSSKWVEAMLAGGPFADSEALLSTAETVWWNLQSIDWLEAFAAHPRIGDKQVTGLCSQEQSGVHSAPDYLLDGLAEGNREYEQRYGWKFLIKATGKTAAEMLAALQCRLQNEKSQELRIAAAEQAKITRLRLEKLLNS